MLVAALSVTLALVLTLGPTLDLTEHRETIAHRAGEAIGREVRIEGPLWLTLGPTLHLQSGPVAIANPSWASQPQLLEVGALAFALDLLPLLDGVASLSRVRFRGARVALEESESGQRSWIIEGDTAAGASSGYALPFRPVLADAEVDDLLIDRRSAASGRSLELRIDRFRQRSEDGMLVLQASGDANELPVELTGRVGPLTALIAARNIEADVRASLRDTELELRGYFGDPAQLEDIELEARVHGT